MRMWVWSLASCSGLRILHCPRLWGRSQTWLRAHLAVAVPYVSSCSCNSTPSLGTSICGRCDSEKQASKNKMISDCYRFGERKEGLNSKAGWRKYSVMIHEAFVKTQSFTAQSVKLNICKFRYSFRKLGYPKMKSRLWQKHLTKLQMNDLTEGSRRKRGWSEMSRDYETKDKKLYKSILFYTLVGKFLSYGIQANNFETTVCVCVGGGITRSEELSKWLMCDGIWFLTVGVRSYKQESGWVGDGTRISHVIWG